MDYRKKTLTPLREILAEIFANRHSPLGGDFPRILRIWPEIAGPVVAEQARPLALKNGRLKAGVADPIWLQEAHFLEPELRERLNAALGGEIVKKIDFRLGV